MSFNDDPDNTFDDPTDLCTCSKCGLDVDALISVPDGEDVCQNCYDEHYRPSVETEN